VVNGPFGAIVPSLPIGVVNVEVNGQTYYLADDNYYRRTGDGFIVVESPHR
jgi:hypothetical protein